MSQDTRKDKRAKVVSLNVRYKSATVDEFIENHSHDVSKGGIFVKTPTPFPPGTLLKFEIRLAGDKSVISGVGRVVWKREPTQAGAEKPAGMGVKFIKIDDASRAIIDDSSRRRPTPAARTPPRLQSKTARRRDTRRPCAASSRRRPLSRRRLPGLRR
ncbi:MAG: TIGR02266 family protein [Labilithrix sp.]|nr:TIGR02266 family protein [Labilithrix sp.]